jgi:hypothetical protein
LRSRHFCGGIGGVRGGEGGSLVGWGGGDADDDLLETDSGGDEFLDATLEIDPEELDNRSKRLAYQVNDVKQRNYTLSMFMGFLRTLKAPPRGTCSHVPCPSGGFTGTCLSMFNGFTPEESPTGFDFDS